MKAGTREHSYFMAQCYDIHIAHELSTHGETHTKRLQLLNEKYEHWTKLHNSYENTLPSNS